MFRLSTLALLGTEAAVSDDNCRPLDEASMLQMPVVQNNLDVTDSECRCPGYYQAECEAEAAQGCIWSSAGTSNAPWCQCGTAQPPVVPPAAPQPVPVTAAPEPPAPFTDCESCRLLAEDNGLEIGGAGFAFAGVYSTKGCYTYRTGTYQCHAYCGTGGSAAEAALPVVHASKARLDDGFTVPEQCAPEPALPWTLIVQYGSEAYPKNSDAVGVVNELESIAAKRSDADINALPSGGDAAYDYYMLTSDSDTEGVSDSMLVRTTEVYDDLSSDFGWGSYGMCLDSTSSVADCNEWTTHGHSRIDSISEDGNDCDRWFSGYNGIMCFGHSGVAHSYDEHCFSHGNSCSLGSHAIRTNVKMYKFIGEGFVDEVPEPEQPDTSSTWTLIVQYASEAYPKNSDAVGVVSDIENHVAKLSDADINALLSGGDAAYDYYMLTSDSDTEGVSDSMIVRTTEVYDDLSSDFGWGSYAMCLDSTSSVADCTQWTTHGHSRIDTISEDGNDCDRWFSGYNGIMCFGHSDVAHSYDEHCFSHGNSCSLGSHAIRTNMRMYKFTRGV